MTLPKKSQIIHLLSYIVYNLSLFNLLFSHSRQLFFAVSTPYAPMRSRDGYGHLAQFSTLIFYACADCTNFAHSRLFKPVWSYFERVLQPDYRVAGESDCSDSCKSSAWGSFPRLRSDSIRTPSLPRSALMPLPAEGFS